VTNEIKIPHEIVNDDVVTISKWNFENRAKVRSEDIVALIETSKAIIEVEAGREGYLEILQPLGAQVRVGDIIGRVCGEKPQEVVSVIGKKEIEKSESNSTALDIQSGETFFSRKARLAMEEYGIEVHSFAGRGLVREQDVLDYYLAHKPGKDPSESSHASMEGGNEAALSDKDVTETGKGDVGLWRDASLAASDRDKGMLWLVFNYVWRTWFLSNLVRWAPRFAILKLHKWRGVKIGRGCFIDPTAIIETAHPHNITIGNDVRIAAQAIIMTHIKPPHFLRSKGIMANSVEPVQLEDSCFIGVGVIIMPGVTVGRAAVVASGAIVVGDVPSYSLVAGNPAKVVKRFSPGD
jgi:serine acetyltransferase